MQAEMLEAAQKATSKRFGTYLGQGLTRCQDSNSPFASLGNLNPKNSQVTVASRASENEADLTNSAFMAQANSWAECISPEGFTYYSNIATGESTWEKPEVLIKPDETAAVAVTPRAALVEGCSTALGSDASPRAAVNIAQAKIDNCDASKAAASARDAAAGELIVAAAVIAKAAETNQASKPKGSTKASTAAAEPKSSVKDRTKDVFGWTVVPSNSKDEAVKIDAVDVVDCISGGPDSEASVTFVEKSVPTLKRRPGDTGPVTIKKKSRPNNVVKGRVTRPS